MNLGTLTTMVVVLALFFGCDQSKPPAIVSLDAEPDSIHQGGVVQLSCAAEDPDGGNVTVSWSAGFGTVDPSVGDSVEYQAPGFDAFDTVAVEVTDDEGEVADSSLVITVAEGLCGGRPEVLAATDTRAIEADSARVYYVDNQADIKWVSANAQDSGIVALSLGAEVELLCQNAQSLFVVASLDSPTQRYGLFRAAKAGGGAEMLFVFGSNSLPLDLAASDENVFVSWINPFARPEEDSVWFRFSSIPVSGGNLEHKYADFGWHEDQVRFRRLRYHQGSVYFIRGTTENPDGEIAKFNTGTEEFETIVSRQFLDSLLLYDRIAIAGSRLFWSEGTAGRIGMVALDGSDPRYVVPQGGRAEGVDLLTAMFDRGEHLVFWSVPDDLRGVNVETGVQADDIERGVGTILALTSNDDFVFYVLSDFGFSRLLRVFIR